MNLLTWFACRIQCIQLISESKSGLLFLLHSGALFLLTVDTDPKLICLTIWKTSGL